ncbi:phospholipid-transporting ATPase ABCA3-like [Vanessa atalanta]|uniref:phospholipid-transporting ATPase ABCA3-like n=1 Tax=Vanessa atalanta TaxID=42275 RepID=UPI001FCD0C14|nr:phospholipid-transporting ATPase ABCA3-like [Vanessa atalanta]XP_047529227.1 phospholipid-transporting ATPase ABCA3-like [Vanessa atalanta]
MKVRKNAITAEAWTKFRLLMWKNFLQQWRHRLQTFLELFLPALTMTLILILRQQIEPEKHTTIQYPPLNAYTLNYSLPVMAGLNFSELSIAYSPQSPVLDDVIRNAMINLFSHNIKELISIIAEQEPDFPDIPIEIPPDIAENINSTLILEIAKRLVSVKAYRKSSELRGIYKNEQATREIIAAVEFDDSLLGINFLPKDLSYALRFPERPRLNSFHGLGGRTWHTDAVFPYMELPGPRFPYSWEGGNEPGYVNEMFIAIQHAISMELISRLTNINMENFNVNFQRYPHAPYINDVAVQALILIFPMFFMLSFSYTAVNIIRVITIEKELQLKETMKIMGLPAWLHWTAWFFKQFIFLFITSAFLMIILKVNWFTSEQGFSDYAVFTNTPWTVLYFYIILYICCTICFCFMISGLFSKGSMAALFGGVIWFMSFIPAVLLGLDIEIPFAVQALSCFSINSAMSLGFKIMLSKENTGGLQWGDFFTTHSVDSTRLLFGHVCVFLLVDTILYMMIALYLEQVLPGPLGTPKPWYFLIQKSFWCSSDHETDVYKVTNVTDVADTIKEKDPKGLEIGVKMSNLTKVYGKNIAVNNMSLNIYDNQITVLLGHNGAGKSTTIAMLTGNVEITRGNIWVAGYNMSTQAPQARSHIGLCPQHNVLFNELTVREHLEFFSRLKGFSGQELNEEIDNLIDRLEMQEKRNYLAQGLSGGQKRRLCVGIALCGGARVVLLDEPTSGMDPASRRALWDLLQKEKKGRSLILTTHFMDEADFLGDRVAIMSSGRLQCVGSPYFLKQHYGVGYTLVIIKKEQFQIEYCTALISKYIPGTVIKEDRGIEVTYNLPNDYSHVFEDMLNDLEKKADIINFQDYGLVATTLEDVFMSVGSDVEIHSISEDTTITADASDGKASSADDLSLHHLDRSDESATGFLLFWMHVSAVWFKLFLVWTRSWGILLLQILVPVIQINISLGILKYLVSLQGTVIERPLTLAQGYVATETFLSFNGSNWSSIGAIAKAGYEQLFNSFNMDSMAITIVNDKNIDDYYLERTTDSVELGTLRNQLLIGATIYEDNAIAWFSNFGFHDVATSLATLHSAILKGLDPEASLNVSNYPLVATYNDNSDMQLMMSLVSMQIAVSIGNSLAITSAVYVMFYIKERISRAKLLQRAAGIQPVVMWGSAFLFDWFWFLLISVTIIISCAAFNVIGLSTATELGRLYLCLMIYGAAMLPLQYLFSLSFTGPALGFVITFFINVIFGLIGSQIVESLSVLNNRDAADILDIILPFFPLYSVVTSARLLNQVGLTKYTCMQSCDYLSLILPDGEECTMETLCKNFSKICCIPENPYFEWEKPGILRYIICSLISGAVLWLILMIFEYNWIQRVIKRQKKSPPVEESSLDADVAEEIQHAQLVNHKSSDIALVARGLTKYYKDNLAVDQISFTVSEAECFGLLGVNGAGKTTTFKMLMGDETISSGDAFVSGYSVKQNITKVYENIGYCPQFDAVFGELTGRETLKLFSRFRGLKDCNSLLRIETLANALGFTKHLDKQVYQYSGGNKRKLSTAVSMLGRTRLIFVDEPTTGVDPAAKRQVWRAIRAARRAGRAFVLTSHSMEECEALCSRLTIMVNGRFQCLGSPQHLKNKYSEGFTLTIKIKMDNDTRQSAAERTEAVKNYVNAQYNNVKLMEEYQGIITYYLPDRSMPWSRMFGIMEEAKRGLHVEDYSILQTTLEQIFLQFTKYQREEL